MPKTIPTRDYFFARLSAVDISKPFDGMAAGSFVDMWGRPLTIKPEDLPIFVANTKRNLEATKDADGNVVGLPIDCMNHDHGMAAGFITDVNLVDGRDVIAFTPRWNEDGMAMISKDQVRYFSPEMNLQAKAIMGGSLTNWPGSIGPSKEILLRPIALSQQLASVSVDESLDERVRNIKTAFSAFTGSWYVWALEVFDGYLICKDDDEDKLYKVNFTEADSGFTFDDRTAWVEMKRAYIESAMQAARSFVDRILTRLLPGKAGNPLPEPGSQSQPINQPEDDMELDVSKLTPEQRQAVLAQLASGNSAELAALVQTRVNEGVAAALATEQRKAHCLALAGTLTGGTAEIKTGLPVDKAELAAFLEAPTPEAAEKILLAIQKTGLVDFSEHGHSREVTGARELPAEVVAKLDSKEITVADLSSPMLALGDLAQYNLTKWQPK
jgi:hypothetical protein